MRPSQQFAAVVLLTLISLAAPACGGSTGEGVGESRGDEALATVEPAAGGAHAPFDLQDALATLQGLRGYYSAFDVTWDGVRDGFQVSGRLDMERIQVRDPAAQEIFATVRQGEAGESTIVAFVQIGDLGWFYHQGEADSWWEAAGRGEEAYTDEAFFTPETFFGNFDLRIDAPRSPSPEQLDGRPALAYDFDEENLTSDDVTFRAARGHVYTSEESGYLIEFFLTADVVYAAQDGLFDSGEIQVSFQVSDIGQRFTVEPPRMARADIPLPSDVTLPDPTPVPLSRREGRTFPTDNTITFQTKSDVADVTSLYQTGMLEHGWELFTYDLPFERTANADAARLQYIKGDDGVAVKIKEEQGVTAVHINFEEADDWRKDPCQSTTRCSVLVLTDFPIPPDAADKLFVSGGGLAGQLHYVTTGSVDEIARFYTTAMPADGWSEAVLADYTPEPDVTALGYVKHDEGAAIFIQDIQNATQVRIEAGPTALAVWDYPNLGDLQMTREFPVALDAEMSRLSPGQLRYRTPYSVAQVEQFYAAALADDGWTTRPGGVQNAETAILRYEKNLTTVSLMVQQALDSSVVWIALCRVKESPP